MFSPLVSFWLSGMPPIVILPYVILKSVLLGTTSGIIASARPERIPIVASVLAIAVTQVVGTTALFLKFHTLKQAALDLIVGYPGILLQLVAAPFIVKSLSPHEDKIALGDSRKN
jgi:hypothetical protein